MEIGKAMTEELLHNGAKVALLDVDETAGRRLKEALDTQFEEERTIFLKCDVQSEEQIKAALQEAEKTFGGIDILCNNAGVVDEDEWEKTVSVNLVGVIRVAYLALDHMNKSTGGRGGVIVNTSSMAGFIPLLSCPVYTAAKHSVVGFTRAMASASTAAGYGIRFNALCPSFVKTDFPSSSPDRSGPSSHLHRTTPNLVKTKGVLNMSQVGESLLQLVADESKNGEALTVNVVARTLLSRV